MQLAESADYDYFMFQSILRFERLQQYTNKFGPTLAEIGRLMLTISYLSFEDKKSIKQFKTVLEACSAVHEARKEPGVQCVIDELKARFGRKAKMIRRQMKM